MLLYQTLAFKIHEKIWKDHAKIKKSNYQLQSSYYISNIQDYFECNLNRETVTDIPSIYINKIENRIRFKINTGYYLELLTAETIKLLGITKSNITKNEFKEIKSNLHILNYGLLIKTLNL